MLVSAAANALSLCADFASEPVATSLLARAYSNRLRELADELLVARTVPPIATMAISAAKRSALLVGLVGERRIECRRSGASILMKLLSKSFGARC